MRNKVTISREWRERTQRLLREWGYDPRNTALTFWLALWATGDTK